MSFLPADGATTRLHKLNHLVEYVASHSKGCTESQLIREGLTLGNTSAKILEYIQIIKTLGLVTRIAQKYYVIEKNYQQWAIAKGFKEETYTIKCTNPGCEAQYNSIMMYCPSCHTSTEENLNEHRGYTHIATDAVQKTQNNALGEVTTEPNTHTHIET